MLALSITALRERLAVFAGAILTITIGVALVQASLLALVAAATAGPPAGATGSERLVISDAYVSAVSLMGLVVGLASFVTIFIVGSTFGFAVAQRRGELALLRLLGLSQGQIQRLLVGEAIALGILGTLGGVLLGLPVAGYFRRTLIDLGFAHPDFEIAWRSWVLAVSLGAGIGVAALGSLGAGRRAGRVPALEALRRTDGADRVMNLSRWVIGLLATGGAVAMLAVNTQLRGESAVAISISLCLVIVIALTALAPLVVPAVAGVVGLLLRALHPTGAGGALVGANVRDGVRRTSTTAAPIVVVVGLVVGLIGGMDVVSAGARAELESSIDADLVVESHTRLDDLLTSHPHVDGFSREMTVVAGIDDDLEDGSGRLAAYQAIAIEPSTYPTSHRVEVTTGALDGLRGPDTIVLSAYLADRLDATVGDTAMVRLDDIDHELTIVAVVGSTLAGPDILLPAALADEPGEHRYFLRTASSGRSELFDLLSSLDVATVAAVDEWTAAASDAAERQNRNIMVAIVSLTAIYAAIAIANAAAMATFERRQEFALLRLTGLSRLQVLRVVLNEGLIVLVVGTLLGGLAAFGTIAGASTAVSGIVGREIMVVPWPLAAAVVSLCAAILLLTTSISTVAATRERPISVVGARS